MRPAPHTSRRPFRSRSREAGISEGDARRAWATLLGMLRARAEVVAAGGVVDELDGRALAGLVIRHKAKFPLTRRATAQAAAEALMILARAWCATAFAPSLAAFVAEGCACLTAMLDDETRAAFAHSLRATGEEQ